MKITVLANCHCLPIAKILAVGTRGCTIDFIDVNVLAVSPFKERAERLLVDRDSLVFSVPLSESWGDLASESLRVRLGDRLSLFTNIHFDGLQPDITYLGRMGSRVGGVLSDYHSKLVLFAFLSGRSAEDCRALFDGRHYEAIGYYAAFEAAASELERRDAACDVRFAARFTELVRLVPALYSVNHPTDAVFVELCAALAAAVGLPFRQPEPYLVTNPLADSAVWPVLDEIAAHHALPYRTPQLYFTPNAFASRSLDTAALVDAFYAAYAAVPRDELASDAAALPFWPGFAAALG